MNPPRINPRFEQELARGQRAVQLLLEHLERMGAGGTHMRCALGAAQFSVIVCPAFEWTDETPTKPGAYWLRMHGFPDRVCHIVRRPLMDDASMDELRVCMGDPREMGTPLARYSNRANFRWCGPIPTPNGGNEHVPAPGELI